MQPPDYNPVNNGYDFFAVLKNKFKTAVYAHRGGDLLWPGNTLYAFEMATALGVDVLEMDVQQTYDGHLVLMHNATVDLTTNGSGYIRELNLEIIKNLDAGYWWTADNGQTFPYRNRENLITVPTLAEIFIRFKQTSIRMNIEIKQCCPSLVDKLHDLIVEKGMVDRVLVGSFYWQPLHRLRKLNPKIATSTSVVESVLFYLLAYLNLSKYYRPQTQALQVAHKLGPLKIITTKFIKAANEQGLQLHGWTVNSRGDMEDLIRVKTAEPLIDGIITDNPKLLLELLTEYQGVIEEAITINPQIVL